jgi:hypothetical protein
MGARTHTTQQSGQTPDKEVDISHITGYVNGHTETDSTGFCYLPSTAEYLAPEKPVCFEPTVWPDTCCSVQDSSVVAMDKTYLVELVRDMMPLWDQRDKNYHNKD